MVFGKTLLPFVRRSFLGPDFSPGRLLLSDTFLLSMSYVSLLNMSLLQTALDAPSLVFFAPAGTCSLRPSPCLQPAEPAPAKAGGQALGATLRAAVAVQIVCPDDLSLNQTNLPGADLDIRRMPAGCAPWRAHINYGYAFGPRIKYGAGSGTRWRKKSGVIIASLGEKSGLGNVQYPPTKA